MTRRYPRTMPSRSLPQARLFIASKTTGGSAARPTMTNVRARSVNFLRARRSLAFDSTDQLAGLVEDEYCVSAGIGNGRFLERVALRELHADVPLAAFRLGIERARRHTRAFALHLAFRGVKRAFSVQGRCRHGPCG